MNKAELIESLAKTTNTTKSESENWLNAFTTILTETISKEEIKLVGFGTFKTVNRAARKGRNPQTGQEINIPATRVPVFTPGKELKENL